MDPNAGGFDTFLNPTGLIGLRNCLLDGRVASAAGNQKREEPKAET